MHVARVRALLPRLHQAASEGVFTELTPRRSLAQARRQDEGRRSPGLLSGMTVAWKDLFPIAGTTTAAGTRFLRVPRPSRDHELVRALSDRGAICVGKTSMSELAFSVLGENDARPAPHNPLDPRRVCGGSSSGAAAAVARNLVDIAVGTDSGGSVRLPAAWCGLVGYKPTKYRIDSSGVVPFSPTLDAVGVLAMTVDDVSAAATALQRGDGWSRPGAAPTVSPLTLPDSSAVDPEIDAIYQQALRALSQAAPVMLAEFNPLADLTKFRDTYGSTAADEGAALWRHRVRAAGLLVSPRLRSWFAQAPEQIGANLRRSRERTRHRLMSTFDRTVRPGFVLATPTSPIVPPYFSTLEDDTKYEHLYGAAQSFLWPFNELDAPAISIPCGHTAAGLPVGLQLVAPQGRDGDVLAAARLAEEVLQVRSTSAPSTSRRARST